MQADRPAERYVGPDRKFPGEVLSNPVVPPDRMDDRALISRLKNGEAEAFREVVRRHQSLVLNCAYKFLRNNESAEDLTQEVFVEVFESIGSFRAEAQLSTWIYRITVTKALNKIKSLKRKRRFAALLSLSGDLDQPTQLQDPSAPDTVLENSERAGILTRALEKIPANQRIAFTLSQVEGMSYEQIAKVMNSSLPSVESLIHRARLNLRKRLSAYYHRQLI
jgi:RNA polymerase sigma factor (sigma-70 family)